MDNKNNDIYFGIELEKYLVGERKEIDFVNPQYATKRQDSSDIRQKILSISYSDWKKLGFSKGTLHYMKKNVEDNKPFTLSAHVRERLDQWENLSQTVNLWVFCCRFCRFSMGSRQQLQETNATMETDRRNELTTSIIKRVLFL